MTDQRLAKGHETKQNILNAAIYLISTSGIHAVTASNLAAHSNVSKSTLFHHFDSISTILINVLDHVCEMLALQLSSDNTTSLPLRTYLLNLGKRTIYFSPESEVVYRVFLAFYYESIFENKYQVSITNCLKTSNENLISHMKHYTVNIPSDRWLSATSALIHCLLDGIGLLLLSQDEQESCWNAWELQVDLILNSISLK